MRSAATGALLLALSATVAPNPVAAQDRTLPGRQGGVSYARPNPFASLFGHRPRFVIRPLLAVLADGSSEPKLGATITWPGSDTANDVALQLLAELGLGDGSYSRAGLRWEAGNSFGPVRVAGAASVTRGVGDGPPQAMALALAGGLPVVGLEFRTTWLRDGGVDPVRLLVPGASDSSHLRPARGDGRYADGEVHASRRFGPVALRVVGGRRFDGESYGVPHWAFAETDVRVWRGYGIVLSGGSRPERPDLGQRGGRFVQLGMRLDFRSTHPPEPLRAPVAAPDEDGAVPDAAVVPLETGRYLLRLRVSGARRVELKGDVTDWSVVAMRRSAVHADLWELELNKPAGVYHVNIRVDGGDWTVPPGLVAVPDRFGGAAGLLNLPPTEEEQP